MPGGQAVGLGTQSLRLSEPTALVVPKGHAKQGSLVLPVEYVPTGHWWQLSPVRPAASMQINNMKTVELHVPVDSAFTSFFANSTGKQAHFYSYDDQDSHTCINVITC